MTAGGQPSGTMELPQQAQHQHEFGANITRQQYARVAAAAGIGSVLEWFDFTVLIALSPVISKVFFAAGESPALQQLSFWLVYFTGYLARPCGSLLFGHICDVHGRRLSLMITLMMMACPTVLIGCLPTYAQAGVVAPILLSLLRVVQGVAVGGELGTAVVFMHELTGARHKSKGGSMIFVGVTAGIISGLVMAVVLNAAVPPAALVTWGWRIPFLAASVTAACGLMLRYKMPESFEFEECQRAAAKQQQQLDATSTAAHQHPQHQHRWWSAGIKNPIRTLFREHWREVLLLFWFETWSAANFYVFYGFLPALITSEWGVPPNLVLGMTLTNMCLCLPLIPAVAHLADKGLPRMAATATILTIAAVCSVPMLLAVRTRHMAAAWLMQMLDLLLSSSIFAFLPQIGSVLFPVAVRATGYNFAHTAAQSWLGGLAPVILASAQVRLGKEAIFVAVGVYLTVCALTSLCALALMWRRHPETNRDAGSSSSSSKAKAAGEALPLRPQAAAVDAPA